MVRLFASLIIASALRAQPVLVAPYSVSAGLGSTFFGTTAGTDTSLDFITAGGNLYRIRQAGTIAKVRFYVNDASNVTAVYFVLWRFSSGTTYTRVAISQGIKPFAFEMNTLIPSSPITAAQGDYVGLRIEMTTGHATAENLFTAKAAAGSSHTYYQLNQTAPTSLNTASITDLGAFAAPAEVYMAHPTLVAIGDSIIGRVTAYTMDGSLDTTQEIVRYVATTYGGKTFQNMGINGQTTTQILARFTADAVNLKPQYLLIEGGVNDVFGSIATNTIVANWTSMLSAAHTAGITPVIILILPWTNGTNAQNQQIDTINGQIAVLAGTYGALVVDARSTVGQFRLGGDPGNFWDQKTAYNLDGVHFNASGQAAIAGVVALTFSSGALGGGCGLQGSGAVQ